jgi:hypothetical protein
MILINPWESVFIEWHRMWLAFWLPSSPKPSEATLQLVEEETTA